METNDVVTVTEYMSKTMKCPAVSPVFLPPVVMVIRLKVSMCGKL